MKKVARLRLPQDSSGGNNNAVENSNFNTSPNAGHNSSSETHQQIGVRTTGRIKKPKAVFDPSDNYLPRSQRPSQVGSSTQFTTTASANSSVATTSPAAAVNTTTRRSRSGSFSSSSVPETANGDFCYVCCKRDQRRGYGKYRMIACLGCYKKAHRACLIVEFEDLDTLRKNYKCEECRSCEICQNHDLNDSKTPDFVICSKCCKIYHVNCHVPSIKKLLPLPNDWKCSKCQDVPATSNQTATTTTPTTTTSNSTASTNSNHNALTKTKSNGSLPADVIREIIGDEKALKSAAATKTQVAKEQSRAQASVKDKPQQLFAKGSQQPENAKITSDNSQGLRQKRHSNDATNRNDTAKRSAIQAPMNSRMNGHSSSVEASNPVELATVPIVQDTNIDTEQSPNEMCIPIKQEIPSRSEVKTWSFEKVADYFSKYFPLESYVFREQEIDGNALLLLTRSDVVKKLPLKLGPSLHIYQHILRIQKQVQNDPTIGWDCGSINFPSPSNDI